MLGINRTYRLYHRRSQGPGRFRMRAPTLARPNARRSLDFVHDQFANGQRFRILNIVGARISAA